jgi:hypothetical protein
LFDAAIANPENAASNPLWSLTRTMIFPSDL